MVVNETVVTVIDLQRSSEEGNPASGRDVSIEPAVIEGTLLVAVGLVSLAVESVTRAVVAALGERSPLAGETGEVHEPEHEAAGSDEVATLAVITGAAAGLAVGAARFVTRMVAGRDRVIRPLSFVAVIPLADRAVRRLEGSVLRMNAAWRDESSDGRRAAEAFADVLVPHVVDAVIDRLDLTELVLERVDIDRVAESVTIDRLLDRVDLDEVVAGVDIAAIIERVDPMTIVERLDVDSVAARVDVAQVLDRLDLVGIARGVIDELDLPEIIRGSTETMTAETRDSVRVQGMRADRFVSRVVDRALLRGDGARSSTPGDANGSNEDPH